MLSKLRINTKINGIIRSIRTLKHLEKPKIINNINHQKVDYIRPLEVLNDKEKVNYELKETHLESIDSNYGLRTYMKDVYKYSGLGFGTTLVVGSTVPLIIGAIPTLLPYAIPIWIGNVCFGFYSINKISKIRTLINTQKDKKGKEYYTEEIDSDKKLWYSLFSISNGITISPALGAAMALSPTILPTAIIGTFGVFGGATMYALNKKDFKAASWQAPLIGCVTGLIGASLVQIGFGLAGNHQIFHIMDMGITGVSLLTFTGLVAADTQNAIKSYYDKTLDSINTSVELLLDATNILLDLIKVLSEIMKATKD